jgi:uracil-DNA glycosylase
VPLFESRNFSNDARTGKIRRDHRRRHDACRAGDVGWVRAKVVGPIARRHPDRARTFRILFSDRHLHHCEHYNECSFLALFDLSSVSNFSRVRISSAVATGQWPARSCVVPGSVRTAHKAVATKSTRTKLEQHVVQLLKCRRCPRMESTPVSGGAIVSDVIIIGQAPGPREPILRRPFAHTAGKTLFRWFEQFCGMNEAAVRSKIYFGAVCRCFPGKNSGGTDRVPAPDEIRNCALWMDDEIRILRPHLIIPVGRLAIVQFIDCAKLENVIGRRFRVTRSGHRFDLIPLPHPSGASPWHKIPPGKALTERALKLVARHPAIERLSRAARRSTRRAFESLRAV